MRAPPPGARLRHGALQVSTRASAAAAPPAGWCRCALLRQTILLSFHRHARLALGLREGCVAQAADISLAQDRSSCGTWHDLPVREVASEEVVVGGHIFVADGVLLRLQLHHSVHQQEGEPARSGGLQRWASRVPEGGWRMVHAPVWQDLLYLLYVKLGRKGSASLLCARRGRAGPVRRGCLCSLGRARDLGARLPGPAGSTR